MRFMHALDSPIFSARAITSHTSGPHTVWPEAAYAAMRPPSPPTNPLRERSPGA